MEKAQQSSGQWSCDDMPGLYLTDKLRPLADSTLNWKFPESCWELGSLDGSQSAAEQADPLPFPGNWLQQKCWGASQDGKLVSAPETGLVKGLPVNIYIFVYADIDQPLPCALTWQLQWIWDGKMVHALKELVV